MSNQTSGLILAPVQDIVKASIFVIVSLVQLIPYSIILWIIYSDKKTYGAPVYRIIFHLGLSDIIQLVFHCTALPFTIFQVPLKSMIVKVCGAILNATSYSFMNFTFLLAFNRFITLSLHPNMVKSLDGKVLNIWFTCGWIYGFITTIWFLTPYCSVLYDYVSLTWGYFAEGSSFMPYVEIGLTGTHLILATIFYLLTILKLLIIKNHYQARNDLKNEIKLLIQAMIIGLFCVFLSVYWNVLFMYLDESYSAYLGNLLWIIQCGLNPFIYLAMNQKIRKSFLEYFGLNTNTTNQRVRRVFTVAPASRVSMKTFTN